MEKEVGKRNTYCKNCGRMLPQASQKEYCPLCEERFLFIQVRDYIRTHNVTEHEVAEHFNISSRLIKQWIQDGRIEYK